MSAFTAACFFFASFLAWALGPLAALFLALATFCLNDWPEPGAFLFAPRWSVGWTVQVSSSGTMAKALAEGVEITTSTSPWWLTGIAPQNLKWRSDLAHDGLKKHEKARNMCSKKDLHCFQQECWCELQEGWRKNYSQDCTKLQTLFCG